MGNLISTADETESQMSAKGFSWHLALFLTSLFNVFNVVVVSIRCRFISICWFVCFFHSQLCRAVHKFLLIFLCFSPFSFKLILIIEFLCLQESHKMVELLRSDIGKMRDENGALIRVISKLSK